MSVLPETKRLYRRWPGYALAVVGAAALLLAGWALLHQRAFSAGEELRAPGFEDIAVSAEDTPFPVSDAMRFKGRPEAVYVYVTVEDLRPGQELEATVERSAGQSLLAWILAGERDRLRVTDYGGEQLYPSDGGVSGVVRFAVFADSGSPLPPGNYTVSVYADSGAGGAAARKDFVIRG